MTVRDICLPATICLSAHSACSQASRKEYSTYYVCKNKCVSIYWPSLAVSGARPALVPSPNRQDPTCLAPSSPSTGKCEGAPAQSYQRARIRLREDVAQENTQVSWPRFQLPQVLEQGVALRWKNFPVRTTAKCGRSKSPGATNCLWSKKATAADFSAATASCDSWHPPRC